MTEVLEGQVDMFDLGIWSGKTSPERSVQTEAKTSRPSSKRSSKSSKQKSPICLMLSRGGWTKQGCLYSDVGQWSVAWRVHDAQFWGVPQRRKRIALVADFGGLSAPEILFERKGLSGDSEPSGAEGEGTAPGAESGADEPVRDGWVESEGTYYDPGDDTICLQGNGIDRADTAGCNGSGWRRGGVLHPQHHRQTGSPRQSDSRNEPVNLGGARGYSSSVSTQELCQPQTIRESLPAAVDCRNGRENPDVNGTLQAKSGGGTSVNLQNIVRVAASGLTTL